MCPSSPTFGAPFTLSLVCDTVSRSPSKVASDSGMKLSLVPNSPVLTVTHSGWSVLSSK
jgi:hypothetical protein